jgi:hypothetical protein
MKDMKDAVTFSEEYMGVKFYEYQPGNGTRYHVVFSSLVGMNQYVKDRIGCDSRSYVVSLLNMPGISPMIVKMDGGLLHYQYVMEKMNLGKGDAVAIAIFIGWYLGRSAISYKDAGVEDVEE